MEMTQCNGKDSSQVVVCFRALCGQCRCRAKGRIELSPVTFLTSMALIWSHWDWCLRLDQICGRTKPVGSVKEELSQGRDIAPLPHMSWTKTKRGPPLSWFLVLGRYEVNICLVDLSRVWSDISSQRLHGVFNVLLGSISVASLAWQRYY